ncbi:MAG: hypothetical protein AAF153_02465 [Pseudomonadota bacterium]
MWLGDNFMPKFNQNGISDLRVDHSNANIYFLADSVLYKIDATNSQRKWRLLLDHIPNVPPVSQLYKWHIAGQIDNKSVLRHGKHVIAMVDNVNGHHLWINQQHNNIVRTVITSSHTITLTDNYQLSFIDNTNGTTVNQIDLSKNLPATLNMPPTINIQWFNYINNQIMLVANDTLMAFNSKTLKLTKITNMPNNFAEMIAHNNKIFAITSNGEVYRWQ